MNSIQKYFSLLILTGLFACNHVEHVEVTKPDTLLTQDEMAKILTELHLIEAVTDNNNRVSDSLTQVNINRYAGVYKKYHVTETAFKKSFNYYKLKPVEIDSIYASVIQALTDLEVKYNANQKSQKLFNPDTTRLH